MIGLASPWIVADTFPSAVKEPVSFDCQIRADWIRHKNSHGRKKVLLPNIPGASIHSYNIKILSIETGKKSNF
jgi:hypothetical protein